MSDAENGSLIIKTIITAIMASGVGLAVKKLSGRKITLLTAVLSMFIGVSVAYVFHDLIYSNVDKDWRIVVISLLSISGEKIGNYLIFQFNVNIILDAIQETFLNFLKKKK